MDLNEMATLANTAVGWAHDHWLTLVLTGEIVGAVLAVKTGSYRRGICWLLAAIATIWAGVYRCPSSDTTAGRGWCRT